MVKGKISAIQKINQLSLRERVIIVAALAGLTIFLAWNFLLAPSYQKNQSLKARIAQSQGLIRTLNSQISGLQPPVDPNKLLEEKNNRLHSEIQALDKDLAQKTHSLVGPQEMKKRLAALLQRHPDLTLLRLENLPAEPLDIHSGAATGEEETEEGKQAQLYRHAVSVVFSGSYNATVSYLQSLRDQAGEFLWQELEITTQEYPQAEIKLILYTLSFDKGWIGV